MQVKVLPTTMPVLGLIDTLAKLGERLARVTEPEALSLPPLESLTVAVHTMLSPTAAVEEERLRVCAVPRVVLPLLHT